MPQEGKIEASRNTEKYLGELSGWVKTAAGLAFERELCAGNKRKVIKEANREEKSSEKCIH